MRLFVGGFLVVFALAGCSQSGSAQDAAAAPRAGQASISPSPESTGLGNGVTRSPSPKRTSGTSATSPAARRTSSVKAVKVTLLRTGGFAGVHDELVVATNGSWTYTTNKGRETGRLSGAVTTRLHRLANDPRLEKEAAAGGRSGFDDQCPDSFQYRLTAGDVTVNQRGCGDQPDRPVYEEMVGLLAEHTPF